MPCFPWCSMLSFTLIFGFCFLFFVSDMGSTKINEDVSESRCFFSKQKQQTELESTQATFDEFLGVKEVDDDSSDHDNSRNQSECLPPFTGHEQLKVLLLPLVCLLFLFHFRPIFFLGFELLVLPRFCNSFLAFQLFGLQEFVAFQLEQSSLLFPLLSLQFLLELVGCFFLFLLGFTIFLFHFVLTSFSDSFCLLLLSFSLLGFLFFLGLSLLGFLFFSDLYGLLQYPVTLLQGSLQNLVESLHSVELGKIDILVFLEN